MMNYERLKILRIICILLIIGLIYLTSGSVEDVFCVKDITYGITENIYNYLRVHELARNVMQGIMFGFIDVILFLNVYLWVNSGNYWRPLISCLVYFFILIPVNFIFQVRRNEDIIWQYSGFPSFVMSYYSYHINDFLSGSISIYVICISELHINKLKIMTILTSIGLIFHFLLLISLRVDYTISILLSALTSHYSVLVSQKLSLRFDLLYSLTFNEHRPLVEEKETTRDLNYSKLSVRSGGIDTAIKFPKKEDVNPETFADSIISHVKIINDLIYGFSCISIQNRRYCYI
jgi:hypothetical protein